MNGKYNEILPLYKKLIDLLSYRLIDFFMYLCNNSINNN